MPRLLVNIDHVATLRNARGEGYPDPVAAAVVCEAAGAAGIVFHLREDRRHIVDDDAYRLKDAVKGLLDFEMAATDEMIGICLDIQPELVTLVPEKRMELTTEGGLNFEVCRDDYTRRVMPKFAGTDILVSFFVDPELRDMEISAELGAHIIELHTGPYAHAFAKGDYIEELDRLALAAEKAYQLGLRVNAGHGLNMENLPAFLQHVPHLEDISIGHALVSDAIFEGLPTVVSKLITIIGND